MNIRMTNKKKKKKEIEDYRKHYIRVRLGDKTKKKPKKAACCTAVCVSQGQKYVLGRVHTVKRKKKNKDI